MEIKFKYVYPFTFNLFKKQFPVSSQ